MDGLEPPLLDETWGLGVRTQSKGETQFILDIYYSIWDDKKRLISDTQIKGKVTIYTKCQPICCRQHHSGKKRHDRHLRGDRGGEMQGGDVEMLVQVPSQNPPSVYSLKYHYCILCNVALEKHPHVFSE